MEPASHPFRTALIDILQTLVLAALLYFGIDAVFARVKVLNISMQPTFYEGDVLLVNKLAYKLGALETGEPTMSFMPLIRRKQQSSTLISLYWDLPQALTI